MENQFGKKILGQCLVLVMALSSCVGSNVASTRSGAQLSNDVTTSGSGSGVSSGATDGTGNTVGTGTTLPPTVEIRHLIEPNLTTDTTYSTGTGLAGGGSYVRKLTLPKNYGGRLYIAGINISTLNSSFIKVRFKFGVGRQVIADIPATIAKAPGITPSTSINVLVLDLRSQPFNSVRLPYDLFDYNEYDTDGNGIDFDNGETAGQDNRDSNLYCRGLQVADDPTFQGVGACDGLQTNSDQPAEECLYSYAKVSDQGLVKVSNSVLVPITPSLPQYKSVTGSSYFQDYPYQIVKKPLSDTIPLSAVNTVGTIKVSEASSTYGSTAVNFINPASIWSPMVISGSNYYYRGPYRLMNMSDWQFKFSDLDGKGRLFRKNSWVDYPNYLTMPLSDDNAAAPVQTKLYYNTYMFPIATKINLGANVAHLSSSSVVGARSENTLGTTGKTLWMDGANARAQSRDAELNHIGSCTVSSSIDIIARDKNGIDYVVASTTDVKLQLVRPTQYSTSSTDDVLYNNFKTCTANESCGGTACCFNSRCWDENLVSQCIDPSFNQGNLNVGASCTTDLQCTSFCCNKTSGLCAPHNTNLTTPVLCSKQIGDSCIAKEFCAKSAVTNYLIVKNGTDASGNQLCRLQTYVSMENGDCKNGSCVPPVQPTAPATIDCSKAVTAPSF